MPESPGSPPTSMDVNDVIPSPAGFQPRSLEETKSFTKVALVPWVWLLA